VDVGRKYGNLRNVGDDVEAPLEVGAPITGKAAKEIPVRVFENQFICASICKTKKTRMTF
jgi:hypothetical protein